jgi:hypothetical protein
VRSDSIAVACFDHCAVRLGCVLAVAQLVSCWSEFSISAPRGLIFVRFSSAVVSGSFLEPPDLGWSLFYVLAPLLWWLVGHTHEVFDKICVRL